MKNKVNKLSLFVFTSLFIVFGLVSLTGCTTNQEQLIKELSQKNRVTLSNFKFFEQSVKTKSESNILILNIYAKKAKIVAPDFSDAIDLIAKEGTLEGTQIRGFKQRLLNVGTWISKVKANPSVVDENAFYKQFNELQAIQGFVGDYNNILIDSINVIAGLTNGKLGKLESPERRKGASEVAGSEYIGNPSFGHWRNDTSGNSFWEWYGMYSMFSHLTSPIYRSSWYSNYGGYSYYDRMGYNYQPRSYQRERSSYYRQSNYLKANKSAMNKVSPRFRARKASNTFSRSRSSGGSSYNKGSSSRSNTFRTSSRSSRSFGGGGK